MTLREYISLIKGKRTFGEKIAVLSVRLGVSVNTISGWLYRNLKPNGALIKKYFKRRKVEVWWLDEKRKVVERKKVAEIEQFTVNEETEKEKTLEEIIGRKV